MIHPKKTLLNYKHNTQKNNVIKEYSEPFKLKTLEELR